MKVYNAFWKVLRTKLGSIMIYFTVFAVISLVMTANAAKDNGGFKEKKVSVYVNDLDDSEASREFVSWIAKNDKLVNDNKKIVAALKREDGITDALYLNTISYSLTIEKGFGEKLAKGETKQIFTGKKADNLYESALFENRINRYVTTAGAYAAMGDTAEDACKKATETMNEKVSVKVNTFSDEKTGDNTFGYFFQYLPYIFVCILLSGLCPVLVTFGEPDLKKRLEASSAPMMKRIGQLGAASSIFVVAVWLAFMILGVIVSPDGLSTEAGLYAVLNSVVLLAVSAATAFLVSQFNPKNEALSMITQIVSMGQAFLCGVFVPQNLLGSGVVAASKFLPAYWYVKANNMLFSMCGEVFDKAEYFVCVGVQAIFAAALFALTLVVAKDKRKAK